MDAVHTLQVNGGKEFVVDFPTAGTQFGCADAVPNGSVPNEHGTWMYGRNGWCDGQQVRLHTGMLFDDLC